MAGFPKVHAGKTCEAELRFMAEAGMNCRQIAELLELSPSMLRSAMCILGIKTPRGHPRKARPVAAVSGPSEKAIQGADPFRRHS